MKRKVLDKNNEIEKKKKNNIFIFLDLQNSLFYLLLLIYLVKQKEK